MFGDSGGIYTLIAVGAIFSLFMFAVLIVMYVLSSIGLYRMAVHDNIENPWLAWIPIGNMYILGKLVDNVWIGSFEIQNLGIVLPVASLVAGILGNIPIFGFLIIIAYLILEIFVLLKLYRMYRPQQAVPWLILSIIFPFMCAIFIFIMRNDIRVDNN